MIRFTVHEGGRDLPSVSLPPPPQRAAAPLTDVELDEADRMLRYCLTRNPELWPFIHGLCRLDGLDGREAENMLTLVRGRWQDDGALATIVGRWSTLRLRHRRALAALADCARDPAVPAHGAIIRGLEDLFAALPPAVCTEVAGWLAHHVVTVTARRSTDACATHIQTITNMLPHLTDDELAKLAPVVTALSARGRRRAHGIRLAVLRLLRHVCDGGDWASFGISAIRALQSRGSSPKLRDSLKTDREPCF